MKPGKSLCSMFLLAILRAHLAQNLVNTNPNGLLNYFSLLHCTYVQNAQNVFFLLFDVLQKTAKTSAKRS